MLGVLRKGVGVCAGLGLLLATGCVPLPDLPAEIAFVYENEATFLMDWHEGSGGLDPGLPEDDLAELDGCWGMVRTPGGEIPVKLFSVYHFDADAGTFEAQALQQDPTGLNIFNVLSVDTGTYEVTVEEGGKEGLRQVVTETLTNNPDTGELEPAPMDEPWEQIDLVTLDGGHALPLGPGEPGGRGRHRMGFGVPAVRVPGVARRS